MKNTIFQGSPIPLTKWFYAVWLMSEKVTGVSAKELERKLQVTYATAWRMVKRLRSASPDESLWGTPLYFEVFLANCAHGSSDYLTVNTDASPRKEAIIH